MEERFRNLLPLLLFTALLVIAAGIAVGASGCFLFLSLIPRHLVTLLAWSFALSSAGALFSFLHLGRKGRTPQVIRGIGRSWLSREALAAALFTIGIGIAMILALGKTRSLLDEALAAISLLGLATTLCIGMLYHLPGQLTWKGRLPASTPAVSSLYLGSSFTLIVSLQYRATCFIHIFFFLWASDFALSVARRQRFANQSRHRRALLFPRLAPAVSFLHLLRLLFPFGVAFSIIDEAFWPVPFVIMAQVVMDRFTFYAGALQMTPRALFLELKDERMRSALHYQNQGEPPA